jgi:hypothetical protein
MASAASEKSSATTRQLQNVDASERATGATPVAAEPSNDSAESANDAGNTPAPDAPPEAGAETRPPADTAGEGSEGKRDARADAPVKSGEEKPSHASSSSEGETSEAPPTSKAARRTQGALAPCAPYASAGALNIRSGGVATLIIGGPGGQSPPTLTTPNWADIAVLPEGRAGEKGWVRYSVRSVSKRPGRFAVQVKTACGSLNIPVTVAHP